ncbi:MAG TPA: tetratricopeptide repeat protein, partial [Pyrinomonadaceae bacterium]
FVDLSSLTDQSRVVDTVAQVLGVREDADKDLLQSLLANIAKRRLLFILDNCEHLLHSCASLVDELLNESGELRILTTGREALGVRGERVFALRPLSVPSSNASKDDATDAVKLFVDRAQLAQTNFEINNDNFADVAEICRRLDGIPLAIELAAARVRVLSVSQIREKLSDRFRLLTSDGRTAVPRHQTLQAAIEWSYEQLSPDEQRLIRSLSVFAGGWTMELAVNVAGADQLDEFEMLDLLTHLIDKSLVMVESEQHGQRRYDMLETVREFTTARLIEAGEIQAVRKEHLKAFLNLAESAYAERVSHEQDWANVLQSEIDNLRAALEFARMNDSERYLELVGALTWFWQVRSHLREGREHLTAALSLPGSESASTARARALWGAAHMLSWQGDPMTAQTWMADAIKLWRELGDDRELAFALEGLGWAQCLAADDNTARSTFEECLRMQQVIGDPAAINRAMVGLAQALVALSAVEEARPMALEIIRFSEKHNDKRSEHFGWHFLADSALIEGNCEESLRLYKRSLGVAQQLGDQLETSFEVQGVAMSLAGLGRSRQAVLLATAAKAEWDRIGADIHIGFWDRLLERYISVAKKSLSEEELASTLNEGKSLPFDDAVRLALEATC